MNMQTGRVVGFECLVRWRNEQDKLLTSESFLFAASRSGLTEEMGRQVIEKTIQATRQFSCGTSQEPLLLSVSLSSDLLDSTRLRQRLLDLLSIIPLHPGWGLQVEIIEGAFQQRAEGFGDLIN